MMKGLGFLLGRLAVLVLLLPAPAVPKTSSRFLSSRERPSLELVQQVLLTTAEQDFDDNAAFEAATDWHGNRLRENPAQEAPHLACAEYSKGRRALLRLEVLLSEELLRRVSNDKVHGTCFIATASWSAAAIISADLKAYDLTSFGPVPSALKLAPGLLNHEGLVFDGGQRRLSTTHGSRMRSETVIGLDLALSPGVLPAHEPEAGVFIATLIQGLMSGSMDLHSNNFWSDTAILDRDGGGDQPTGPAGKLLAREWRRAADAVHGVSDEKGRTPGDVCSWGDINLHHAGSGSLMVTGMDHLLHLGRGAGGKEGAEADELQMACLMGLVSFFAAVPEVQRIAPLHLPRLHNAVAGAVVQSGNIVDKPLTNAGLDGTGEIIQIVDTGVDETSCFFVDEDGAEIVRGYYFEKFGFAGSPSKTNAEVRFAGGNFSSDLTRRKIVQYISLVRPDEEDSLRRGGFETSSGREYSWYSAIGFDQDLQYGHGTHTAGSAAGATLTTPAEVAACDADEVPGCVGGCFVATEAASAAVDDSLTWDTLCPRFDCDGLAGPCLGEDVPNMLAEHGGVARGAKLAIFDASRNGFRMWASLALNGLWDATEGTGCVLHCNPWGDYDDCFVDTKSVTFDQYMFENPEHLLMFAAGNLGAPEDESGTSCTINSAGIAKNVLTVGASSSGATRRPVTGEDGELMAFDDTDFSDIDTVAVFSSYGPTRDGRIKPEVVAPGDHVLSAASDGSDDHSCQLAGRSGTSMSTAHVAGAAAMIRQYFKDETFYAEDVNQRGLCGSLVNATNAFFCETFSPSAATVKGMLINSADLMGGSSEPDGFRGFGRVHLEAGMPLGGQGDLALFVADAFETELEEYTADEYRFEILPDTGLELRATLTWIDPAASAEASVQLQNDLDLAIVAPDGTTSYRMFAKGVDERNVVERVIVSPDVIGATAGAWTVSVSCFGLTTDTQPYSLVVTGPIDGGSGARSTSATSAAMGRVGPGFVYIVVTVAAVALVFACIW